jgi:hypothetical protein
LLLLLTTIRSGIKFPPFTSRIKGVGFVIDYALVIFSLLRESPFGWSNPWMIITSKTSWLSRRARRAIVSAAVLIDSGLIARLRT